MCGHINTAFFAVSVPGLCGGSTGIPSAPLELCLVALLVDPGLACLEVGLQVRRVSHSSLDWFCSCIGVLGFMRYC